MTSTCLNDVLTEVYNAVICKIYTLLYGIKLNTKLIKAFCCRQSRICRDDIGEAKYLLFCQVKILSFRTFEKQLHISTKLV